MSIEIFPVFNPDLPAAVFDAEGKVLTAGMDELDRLAAELDVPLLSSFADNRPIPDAFEGDPTDLDEDLGEWEEWFSPADALGSIDALLQAIRENPDTAGRLQDVEFVVHDLSALRHCLGIAAAAGALFRLEVPL